MHMYVDRVSVGLQLACVKACPTSCLQFGPKDAMLEVAHKRVDHLWLVAYAPWELRGLRYAAVLVHAVAGLLTIGGFIVHLYMGLLAVPEGLSAILHGEVTERWAGHHHSLWVPGQARGVSNDAHHHVNGSRWRDRIARARAVAEKTAPAAELLEF